MSQTLTLRGVLQRILVRDAHSAPEDDSVVQLAEMFVQFDPAHDSSLGFPAVVYNAQLPKREAVRQARPGDRVEIVGHWEEIVLWTGLDEIEIASVVVAERFRVVGG